MEKIIGTELIISISKIFEENFRYLMSKVNVSEWGGIVIYDKKNSLLDEKVEIELLDFYLMDIGTAATTEHDYAENPEFIDLAMEYPGKPYGLIHSHGKGSVFYSKTDEDEIEENERFYPEGYLSVVTNALGDILVRLSTELDIKITSEIEHEDKIRKISETITTICYIQTEININEQYVSEVMEERISNLKKLKEAKEKAKEKANAKKYKHYNNINSKYDKQSKGIYGYESKVIPDEDEDDDEFDVEKAIEAYYKEK